METNISTGDSFLLQQNKKKARARENMLIFICHVFKRGRGLEIVFFFLASRVVLAQHM